MIIFMGFKFSWILWVFLSIKIKTFENNQLYGTGLYAGGVQQNPYFCGLKLILSLNIK